MPVFQTLSDWMTAIAQPIFGAFAFLWSGVLLPAMSLIGDYLSVHVLPMFSSLANVIVCVITGTGLKEPELASRYTDIPVQEVAAELDAVEKAMALAVPSTTAKGR